MQRIALALSILIALAPAARADGGVYQWLRIGGEVGTVGVSEFVFKAQLAPSVCRWCATNAIDDSVRSALVWGDQDSGWGGALADLLADGLSYGTLGADAITMAAAAGHDAPTVIESASVAALTTQVIKFSVGRERPYAHYYNLGDDDNLSFVSGHTAIATASAVSAGMITRKPWVWGVGLGLAGATGYLRIAADKHYLSDVLAGAAIGALAGWAITRLAGPSATSNASTAISIPVLSGAW